MKKIFSGIVGIFGGVAPIVIQIVAWFALLSPMLVIFDEYHVSFFWSLIILTVLELLIVIPFAQQCIQAVFWIWSAVLVSKDITLASPFYWIGAVLAALYFLSIAFGIIMAAVEWVSRSVAGNGETKVKEARKVRYCSHCGNLIDTETGKCTGCGRQSYSIINISNLLKSLSLYKPEILKKLNGAIGYFGYVIWILLTSFTIYMPLCVIGENYKISAVGVILISALLQGLSVLPFLEFIYETALWVWIIVLYNDVSKLLMPFHWIGFVLYIGMTLIPLFRRLYVYVRDR